MNWTGPISVFGGTVLGFVLSNAQRWLKERRDVRCTLVQGKTFYAATTFFGSLISSDIVFTDSTQRGTSLYVVLDLMAQNMSAADDAITSVALYLNPGATSPVVTTPTIDGQDFLGRNIHANSLEHFRFVFTFSDEYRSYTEWLLTDKTVFQFAIKTLRGQRINLEFAPLEMMVPTEKRQGSIESLLKSPSN